MSNILIYPYKKGSKSVRSLKVSLPAKVKRTSRKVNRSKLVINFGSSNSFNFQVGSQARVLNKPEAIRLAVNKLSSFQRLHSQGVSVPEFTTDINIAKSWIEGRYKVVIRNKLTGHSGEGAVVVDNVDQLTQAPLYTKFIRNNTEYRVHVMNGECIDFIQKKRRSGFEGGNSEIKSHSNGWVFCRNGVTIDEDVKREAIKAVAALGLDFGAVDVVTQVKRGEKKVYVLEVNTAPAMEGTTLTKYTEGFKSYVRS